MRLRSGDSARHVMASSCPVSTWRGGLLQLQRGTWGPRAPQAPSAAAHVYNVPYDQRRVLAPCMNERD